MDYSIGSVADLISGSITPNKQKVVKKQFKIQRKSLDNANQGKSPQNKDANQGKSPQNKDANKVKPKKHRNTASPKIKQIEKSILEGNDSEESDNTFDLEAMFKNSFNKSDTMDNVDLCKINGNSKEVKKSPNKNKKLKRKSLNISEQEESAPNAKLTKKGKKKAKAQTINKTELTDNTNEINSDNELSTAESEVEAEAIVNPSKNVKKNKKQKLKRKSSNDTEEVNVPAKKKSKKEKAVSEESDLSDNLSDNDSNSEDSEDENKKKSKKTVEPPNPNHVTIFVGNLPLSMTKQKLKKLFSKFDNVVNARIRSIPIADPKVPKKVAAIRKQFHADRTSVHGYVTFSERESAEKALSYNGKEYKDHHLRVNIANITSDVDKDRAIFLGNVSFEAEEEEFWKLFESCGEIESVRLVRDRRTNVGKGFGYVNFKSSDSVELALQMGEVKLKDRVLRVSLYNTKAPKKENKSKQQKGENSERNMKRKKIFLPKKNSDKGGNSTKEQFQGKIATTEKKKKFNKGNQQKKNLAKKIAPKSISG